MNSQGHHITCIYMSGGQAKNRALMQLMADVGGMGIVLPTNDSEGKKAGGVFDPVVLGAAMLGRYADAGSNGGREGQAEKLWGIMVCFLFLFFFLISYLHFSRWR
jgi:ribulose kinase